MSLAGAMRIDEGWDIWAGWCLSEAQNIFLLSYVDLVPVRIQVSDLKLWWNLKLR